MKPTVKESEPDVSEAEAVVNDLKRLTGALKESSMEIQAILKKEPCTAHGRLGMNQSFAEQVSKFHRYAVYEYAALLGAM